MKAVLVGVGQAGGRVLEELVAVDREAGHGAVAGAVAVNTARGDLRALSPAVDTHLVGDDGDGVGGDSERGAEVMGAGIAGAVEAVEAKLGPGVEAVLVVAGLGGGTGGGGAPVLARQLRRTADPPVYGLGLLPGQEGTAMAQVNAGRSLKTLLREADAVLAVDNDAWRSDGGAASYDRINRALARRVGLLLAAGEAGNGPAAGSAVGSKAVTRTLAPGGIATVGYAAAPAAPDPGDNADTVLSTARNALLTGSALPGATEADAALLAVAGDPGLLPRRGIERARRWLGEETGTEAVRGGVLPVDDDRVRALVLLGGVDPAGRVEEFLDRAREAARETDDRRRDRRGSDPKRAFENDDLDDLL